MEYSLWAELERKCYRFIFSCNLIDVLYISEVLFLQHKHKVCFILEKDDVTEIYVKSFINEKKIFVIMCDYSYININNLQNDNYYVILLPNNYNRTIFMKTINNNNFAILYYSDIAIDVYTVNKSLKVLTDCYIKRNYEFISKLMKYIKNNNIKPYISYCKQCLLGNDIYNDVIKINGASSNINIVCHDKNYYDDFFITVDYGEQYKYIVNISRYIKSKLLNI